MSENESKAPVITELVPWTEIAVYSATASDITNYINQRITEYEDEEVYGSELQEYFATDFNKFSLTAFKKTTDSTKYLRDFLRKRNVYIQKSRGQSIPAALVDALSNEWCSMPENMINEVMEIYRPVNSPPALRDLKIPPNYPTSFNNPIITLMKAYTEEQKYAELPSESCCNF
ncbi:hypothetical protein K3495_g13907 [Podosphaera aphanis]|nr:hypothetical protein K3495_g13907 [Podosphaera aphanis]